MLYKKNIIYYINNIENFIKKIFFIIKKNILYYKKNINNNVYIYYIFFIMIFYFFVNGFHIIKETERGIILRFGKFNNIEYPGLNWKIYKIDKLKKIDIKKIKELISSNTIITSDESLIFVKMNIQYIINNPFKYFFNVENVKNNLKQIIDSVIREIIGNYTINNILIKDKILIKNNIYNNINNILLKYDMGVSILDINFQEIKLPKKVKNSFEDIILSKEDKKKSIIEAKNYSNEILLKANNKAKKIIEDSKSYRIKNLLKAKGEIEYFKKILSSYKLNPEITKKKLYLDSIEKSLKNVKKIIINKNLANKILLLEINNNDLNKIKNTINKNNSK